MTSEQNNAVKINDRYVGTSSDAKKSSAAVFEKFQECDEIVLDMNDIFNMTVEYAKFFIANLAAQNIQEVANIDDKKFTILGARHVHTKFKIAMSGISRNAEQYGDAKSVRNNIVAIRRTMENAKFVND